jgi:tRNA (uracil-5-)-methyltransferase
MFDKNNDYILMDKFNIASESIYNIQPKLLKLINENQIISKNLFQVNFRSNNDGDILVTLIYRKRINDDLCKSIDKISKSLGIMINVRSKKKLYKTHAIDFYERFNSKSLNLKIFQSDKTFFQPNKYIYPKMYEFIENIIDSPRDLLELYCGVGSFSLPLSHKFKKVFASENNRESINMLNKSLVINNITNVCVARLNAEEVTEVFSGKKFNRMKDIKIDEYSFSHILVDPPRCGLDNNVIKLINNFENLIYISCNPDTYINDLKLLKNFKIKDIAIFDQFTNTDHLEIVSILKKVN